METELKIIPGYSLYRASYDGRIYSTITCKFLSCCKDKDGYLQCMVKCDDGKTKMRKVHRLIAFAWIPIVDGKNCIDHINGIVFDNRVENLRWCTVRENNSFYLARTHNSIAQKILCANPRRRERMRETQREVCKRPEWIERQRRSHSSVRVQCVETGDVFMSTSDAARFANTSNGNIGTIIHGRGKLKSIHGFHFVQISESEYAAATLTACVTY